MEDVLPWINAYSCNHAFEQLGLDSSHSHGVKIKSCNQTVEGPSQIRYGEPLFVYAICSENSTEICSLW